MRWNPWAELRERPELTIVFVPMCPAKGAYFPDRNLIVIAAGQTRALRRSVAAEELGHHELGHRRSAVPGDTARMEKRARSWAAERLISVEALAEALVGAAHWDEVAETLDVDLAILMGRVEQLSGGEMMDIRRRLCGRILHT